MFVQAISRSCSTTEHQKTDIKQREIDHRNAELAKRRFDARQDRLIRLEQEKIAAKQARQTARKSQSAK